MAKKVYAVRVLVETDDDIDVVENMTRRWGESMFGGFVLLDLTQVKTSLAEIDTLAHVISKMTQAQGKIHEALGRTTTIFEHTAGHLQKMTDIFIKANEPDETTDEEVETEETQNEATDEDV